MFFYAGLCLILLGFVTVWYVSRPKPPPPPPPPRRLLTDEELALANAMSYIEQLEEEVRRKRDRKATDFLSFSRSIANSEDTLADLQRRLKRADQKKVWLHDAIGKAFYDGNRDLYRLDRICGIAYPPVPRDIDRRLMDYIDDFEQRVRDATARPSLPSDTWARGRRGIVEPQGVLEAI